jgi:DNA-binding IclR family transcriptional regulator
MYSSDKTFAVLDALHREEISNQRQLANHAGVSLGQVNYLLKGLIEKGFVKILSLW